MAAGLDNAGQFITPKAVPRPREELARHGVDPCGSVAGVQVRLATPVTSDDYVAGQRRRDAHPARLPVAPARRLRLFASRDLSASQAARCIDRTLVLSFGAPHRQCVAALPMDEGGQMPTQDLLQSNRYPPRAIL